VEVHPLAS
jgi:EF-hand domain pair